MTTVASESPILRDVTALAVGDVIAGPWLPLRRPGRVIFVRPFVRRDARHSERWVFVAYETDSGMLDGTAYLASEGVRLDLAADPTGQLYSRPSAPVDAPAGVREPLHTGAVTEGGLVDETEKPLPKCLPGCHRTDQEYGKGSSTHVDDCPEWAAGRARETEAPASGLTLAADRSRGALAGTTPVVTYFSFGHGQRDPRSGKKLLGHYATVVAPTYEACQEAMSSRFGRNWSMDYLAGTTKATAAMSCWTEHEVIVAPGTDPALADAALKAARDLLAAASAE